jgi:hypothetical protein
MSRQVDERATATQIRDKTIEQAPAPTGGASTLNRDASALRDDSGMVHEQVVDLHQRTRVLELDDRTTQAARRAPSDLLQELAHERGLSWALIAKLAGVSPTAVRKWRRGEACTPENRRALARLIVFLKMVGEAMSPIEDPESWLEMPLSDDATLAAADLYAAGELDLVLELASDRVTAHQALDTFDSEWRRRYERDERFEIVRAPDGDRTIVER